VTDTSNRDKRAAKGWDAKDQRLDMTIYDDDSTPRRKGDQGIIGTMFHFQKMGRNYRVDTNGTQTASSMP
jgi:hypothetical protein